MAVPFQVIFDRYSQVSSGIESVGLGSIPNGFGINGISVVTQFLYGGAWQYCGDPVVTSWTACGSPVSTTWTAAYTLPVTAWTLLPGG